MEGVSTSPIPSPQWGGEGDCFAFFGMFPSAHWGEGIGELGSRHVKNFGVENYV